MRKLNQRIARFYDVSSQLWEEVWGEHMHHGYYAHAQRANVDPIVAQEVLIDVMLDWAGVHRAAWTLDVGCGIGGSARYLAEKISTAVVGMTLSQYQAHRAAQIPPRRDDNFLAYVRGDAQQMPFRDQQFDLVWAMESAEHFPQKQSFLEESFRVLAPGGTLLMATWCCRSDPPPHVADRWLLNTITRAYALPPWVMPELYTEAATSVGFEDVRIGDWSEAVAPFWGEVMRRALSWQGLKGILRSGPIVMRGASVVPLMMWGYRRKTIRFITLTARKA